MIRFNSHTFQCTILTQLHLNMCISSASMVWHYLSPGCLSHFWVHTNGLAVWPAPGLWGLLFVGWQPLCSLLRCVTPAWGVPCLRAWCQEACRWLVRCDLADCFTLRRGNAACVFASSLFSNSSSGYAFILFGKCWHVCLCVVDPARPLELCAELARRCRPHCN